MNFGRKKDLYDLIKSISKQSFTHKIVSFFYKDDNELKNDVNNFEFSNIMNKFSSKLMESSIEDIFNHFVHQTKPIQVKNNKVTEDFIEQDSETYEDSENNSIQNNDCFVYDYLPSEYDSRINPNDIKITIQTTLEDIYSKNYKRVTIKRKIDPNNFEKLELIIPILKPYIIYDNLGDLAGSNNNNYQTGNLIIKRIVSPSEYLIQNNDLVLIKKISLYEYIYGFSFVLDLFGKKLDLNYIELFNRSLSYTLENYGIPFNYEAKNRGNLIIQFMINFTDNNNKKQILQEYFSNC